MTNVTPAGVLRPNRPVGAAIVAAARRVRWWQVLFVLALLGQFLAPLFTIIHVWPFGPIAVFIYWLGATVCPIANDAPTFLGLPMVVCPLCYGALAALTTVTFAHPRPGRLWTAWARVPALARYGLILALIVPWLSAYVALKAAVLALPDAGMFALGLLGGTGTALLAFAALDLAAPAGERR